MSDQLNAAPVPEGWYHSTSRAGQWQYWDGAAWTENYAPINTPPVAPAPAQPGTTIVIQQRRSSLSTLIRVLVFVFIILPLIIWGFIFYVGGH
jgi:hypothetical protein